MQLVIFVFFLKLTFCRKKNVIKTGNGCRRRQHPVDVTSVVVHAVVNAVVTEYTGDKGPSPISIH